MSDASSPEPSGPDRRPSPSTAGKVVAVFAMVAGLVVVAVGVGALTGGGLSVPFPLLVVLMLGGPIALILLGLNGRKRG